jgi:glycerol-3-phosphate cytidylyltransferase-like family protein
MEEQIELMIPIKVNIIISGKTRQQDNKYLIRWFDNTNKVIEVNQFQYFGYNMQQVLQEVAALHQLNPRMILEIKITTI